MQDTRHILEAARRFNAFPAAKLQEIIDETRDEERHPHRSSVIRLSPEQMESLYESSAIDVSVANRYD